MTEQSAKSATHPLFQQAVEAFTQRRYPEALPLLERAAGDGDAEAQNLLGVMHLNGIAMDIDARRAAELFGEAAAQGLKEACYNLCNQLFNGLGVAHDEARAKENLLAAARAGHKPALRSLGLFYHEAGGGEARWATLATQCFQLAAQAGDAHGQYLYGMRLAGGHGVAADANAARHWFAAAARSRIYLAQARLADQAASTDGTSPGTSAGAELVTCSLPELPEPRPSRAEAFMAEYRHALDEYLADHLINVAAPMLVPSGVVDPDTGGAVQSQVRTSYSMHFQPSMYDPTTYLALRRIARIAGLPAAHAEPLGVLRYGPGQEYKPHYDFYCDDNHHAQRISTVFVYLNPVDEGGGTDFPRLGVKVEPERGKAVKFLNCDADGKPNPETLHAGLPVIRGEKWLATLWFWDRPSLWFS